MLEITPIKPHSAVDDAASHLRTAVLRGELQPGERLPAERLLAERFSASRVTVRSALGRLVSERLLKTRQGSGYEVLDFVRAAGPSLLGALYELGSSERRHEILRDLLTVRRHLARALFERLADGRPDLTAAHAAVDALEAAGDAGDLDGVVQADLEIVRALCAASGSLVLQLCMNPVSEVLRALPALQRSMFRDPASNVAAYRMVLAWLADPEALGGAAVIHALDAELQRNDLETLDHLIRGLRPNQLSEPLQEMS